MVPLPEPRTGDNSTADLTGVIRARRREVWRKRLIAIGIVVALLVLAGLAWFSPVLSLDKVSVKGSDLVDNGQVSNFAMDAHAGTPLPQLRLGSLEKDILEKFPRAEKASIHYAGPRSLSVEITDRTPVVAIANSDGFELFDAEAVDLGPVDKAPKGLTVLEDSGGAPDRETVAAVIRFMAELRPELRSELLTIGAKDALNLSGEIDTGDVQAKVVFGDSTSASLKMRTAAQLAADGRTEIDVSVPSVPVTN